MNRVAPYLTCFTLLASLSLFACSGGQTNGATTSSPEASSSAGSVAGTSGSTTGPQTSGGSGTASGGTGTGSSAGTSTGAASSSGTTTGAPPVFIDGGYVSCALDSAPDAGPNGDGGAAFWNCTPGTYFCDTSGNLGSCAQCRSDADCSDPNLPTYDARKPHCDTSSGIPGAQSFCQECITNSDCAGNPNGEYCDVNPIFQQPFIETIGFETCNKLVTDCRVDGGPVCGGINEYCDSQSGHCLTRSGACGGDDDCVGYLSPTSASTPEPYCNDGFCAACLPGNFCPSNFCTSDDTCTGGNFCDLNTFQCSCTDDSQCSGLWPYCLFDATRTNDAGQPVGYCGCDNPNECPDGLTCLAPQSGFGVASCGIPCSSPQYPASCEAATSIYPVCNPQTGLCGSCTNDNQCRVANDPNGPKCDVSVGGFGSCGCDPRANDCPIGEVCAPGGFLGTCTPALSRCTPGSCLSGFCNWDSGVCAPAGAGASQCITDYDCAITSFYEATCVKGSCLQCQSSADCLSSGAAKTGGSLCCLPGVEACQEFSNNTNTCLDTCAKDQDCNGNGFGSSCILSDAGYSRCGCGSDSDCTSYAYGSHCDRNAGDGFFGFCGCASTADCQPGQSCQIYSGTTGYCLDTCFTLDAGACADGYFCDPSSHCRPRCDDGNQCQGPSGVCDTQNTVGQNDSMYNTAVPGVDWCYSCIQPSDCPAGQGCDPKVGCNHCSSDAQCPGGTTCIDGGVCQLDCAGGSCPSGEVCDVNGLVGFGPNVCYGCITAADCPSPEGCSGQTHTCGECIGPNASGGPYECPPDAICSNYWTFSKNSAPGVCLANCDRTPCPASEPICALYPGLTPDHKYCFGCLNDSDCGANQRCNLGAHPTFTCVDKT